MSETVRLAARGRLVLQVIGWLCWLAVMVLLVHMGGDCAAAGLCK